METFENLCRCAFCAGLTARPQLYADACVSDDIPGDSVSAAAPGFDPLTGSIVSNDNGGGSRSVRSRGAWWAECGPIVARANRGIGGVGVRARWSR